MEALNTVIAENFDLEMFSKLSGGLDTTPIDPAAARAMESPYVPKKESPGVSDGWTPWTGAMFEAAELMAAISPFNVQTMSDTLTYRGHTIGVTQPADIGVLSAIPSRVTPLPTNQLPPLTAVQPESKVEPNLYAAFGDGIVSSLNYPGWQLIALDLKRPAGAQHVMHWRDIQDESQEWNAQIPVQTILEGESYDYTIPAALLRSSFDADRTQVVREEQLTEADHEVLRQLGLWFGDGKNAAGGVTYITRVAISGEVGEGKTLHLDVGWVNECVNDSGEAYLKAEGCEAAAKTVGINLVRRTNAELVENPFLPAYRILEIGRAQDRDDVAEAVKSVQQWKVIGDPDTPFLSDMANDLSIKSGVLEKLIVDPQMRQIMIELCSENNGVRIGLPQGNGRWDVT